MIGWNWAAVIGRMDGSAALGWREGVALIGCVGEGVIGCVGEGVFGCVGEGVIGCLGKGVVMIG
mgnify:CR=1 FL=1